MDCIFCKIASGEIPCKKAYEDAQVLAFYDLDPQSTNPYFVDSKDTYWVCYGNHRRKQRNHRPYLCSSCKAGKGTGLGKRIPNCKQLWRRWRSNRTSYPLPSVGRSLHAMASRLMRNLKYPK